MEPYISFVEQNTGLWNLILVLHCRTEYWTMEPNISSVKQNTGLWNLILVL